MNKQQGKVIGKVGPAPTDLDEVCMHSVPADAGWGAGGAGERESRVLSCILCRNAQFSRTRRFVWWTCPLPPQTCFKHRIVGVRARRSWVC